MIERKYFHINEGMARAAKNANSFSDYVEGSATAEYKSYVDCYSLVYLNQNPQFFFK